MSSSTFRLPVLSLFTLKDQLIAFAGSLHVVMMDLKKKEQHVMITVSSKTLMFTSLFRSSLVTGTPSAGETQLSFILS